MFRSTAPRLVMAVVLVAAVAPLALPAIGANAAPKEPVRATDNAFGPDSLDVEAGDTVSWVLDPNATNPHQVTLDANGNGDFDDDDNGEFDLSSPDLAPGTRLTHTFDEPGTYKFFCRHHLIQDGMAGTIHVAEAPTTTTTEPPTTTTTVPAATTTTTAPAGTTTTTRPRATTTTTPPPAATPTTQPPASASDDEPDTTNTTARATTTTGKATTGKATTTTTKKKPTTTTRPPETTTTSAPPALPTEWIPTPDMVPDGSPTTTTTDPDFQAAADHRPKSGKGGGGGFPVAGAAGLGVLLLGGLGWAWYHRSSRYLPA